LNKELQTLLDDIPVDHHLEALRQCLESFKGVKEMMRAKYMAIAPSAIPSSKASLKRSAVEADLDDVDPPPRQEEDPQDLDHHLYEPLRPPSTLEDYTNGYIHTVVRNVSI
jgi:hypothetical protein